MGEPRDPERTDPSASQEAEGEQDHGPEALPPEVEFPLRPGEDTDEARAGRLEAWKRRTATGAILSSFAFGLREVLEPDRNEPAVVMETSGVPPKDLPVEADLEDAPPRQSVVRIRPWLLEGAAAPAPDRAAGQAEATPAGRGARRRRGR